ncbi:hypothetical protein [Mucilaginibacter sp. 22184]|uniref:hypothetical protein n=1 Tax=Mucilaginibacter sp. 22184 TaxID=3453887 RepID=UPI003F864340
MRLLPYENFYIVTQLKPAEVQERLATEIEPVTPFTFRKLFVRKSAYFFKGYVEDNRFKIIRIIFHRNSFLPFIKGSTESYLTGNRVHIIMYMHILVTLFMCIWFGMTGFGAIIYLTGATPNKFSPPPLIALSMFLFGYGMMIGAFKYESIKAKDKLLELFEGEIDYK